MELGRNGKRGGMYASWIKALLPHRGKHHALQTSPDNHKYWTRNEYEIPGINDGIP